VTKALLQSGISTLAATRERRFSALVDVLSDANDFLQELGFILNLRERSRRGFDVSASINYPIRGAVTFKFDRWNQRGFRCALQSFAAGVMGGALIVVGEDYGEGSSYHSGTQHRSP